jgi:hypothetical protein
MHTSSSASLRYRHGTLDRDLVMEEALAGLAGAATRTMLSAVAGAEEGGQSTRRRRLTCKNGYPRGRSSMAEPQPSKLVMRVRSPSPALFADLYGSAAMGPQRKSGSSDFSGVHISRGLALGPQVDWNMPYLPGDLGRSDG